MISIKDCIDYSDLTEEEVAAIAEHEQLPYACAAQMACCLAQTQEGTETLRCLLKNAVCDAASCGHEEALQAASKAYMQFQANHPQPS